MKLTMLATMVSIFSILGGTFAAPFGSVPIDKPTTEASTPGVAAPAASPQTQIDAESAPSAESHEVPSVWDAPPPTFQSSPMPTTASSLAAPAAPTTPTGGMKWVQDARGARYQVSTNATLPQGWVEIPAPAMATQTQIQTLPAPAPNFQQPQTYSGGQPAVNLPRAQVQPQSPAYYSPNPNMTPYQMAPPSARTGLPPGKKRMRHQSGYMVIVSEDAIPGPEFTEVESSPLPAAPQPPQYPQAPAQGFAPPPQAPPQWAPQQQAPQTYSAIPQQPAPQQPAYYQQPQTYNSAPQLPHIPPTWQQQLPYQPPQPQYQPPMPGQQMPYQQQMQQAPLPVVRKTPIGKKWVADQSGLRYLVDESTTVMPPMREVTEAELNQPMYVGPQPGQQQQPQGSAIGRFFQGITGNR